MGQKRKKTTKPRKRDRYISDEKIEQIKKYFGPYAKKYTTPQLIKLDRELAIGASLLLELYFERKAKEKEPGVAQQQAL